MKMKFTIMLLVSCVALASAFIVHAAMKSGAENRGRSGGHPALPSGHPALPVGLVRPGMLPPGPEREAMQARLDAFVAERRAWIESMRQARDSVEAVADPERQRYSRALAQARTPAGEIDLWKLPAWARQKLIESAENERRDSEGRGPSRVLKEIAGERSDGELSSIYQEVNEVAWLHRNGAPGYKDWDRVAGAIVARLRQRSIEISVDQVKRLLTVEPIGSLWMRD